MIATLLAALVAAPTVITDVTVHVGDGTTKERVNVVIDGGRIKSVGGGAPPAGAKRIDGSGKVLTPGLIEGISQLGLTEVGLEDRTNDDQLEDMTLAPGFRAADGLNPLSPRLPISREEGVTSAVVSPRGRIVYGTGYWLDLTGSLASRPDPARPIAMFGGVGGGGAANAAGGARGGIWMRLRQLFEDARFFRANRAAVDRGEARALIVTPMHLAAMGPVLDGTLPLVLEADRATDILDVIGFAREQKIRVVVAGGAEAWRVAAELATARVPVMLRPSTQAPYTYDALLARDDSPALLHTAGVPLIITSGDYDQNVRRLRQEAGMAVAFGLPHAEALRAVTQRVAEVFGRGSELGTVTAGKRADLVVWSGDPFETTTIAEHVLIAGEPMSMTTRQRLLVERYLR